ncbi:hypothetical protein L7F22_010764 [Adiantum nelumboides]|nr:hypothetical protein [Adiantum nelumboides]
MANCGTSSLPQLRRQFLKQNQGHFLAQGHAVRQNNGPFSKQQMAQNRSFPASTLKYWLAASFCLNALCVSILLSFIRPDRQSDWNKQGAIENRGHFLLNGAGKAHLGFYNRHCSGQGSIEHEGVNGGRCRCYSCFTGSTCSELKNDCTVNFDHGDPKMFEKYWSLNQETVSAVLLGGDRMSYFSNTDGVCWFLEPSLSVEIKLMHKMVGNAITDGYHIVVGTGSSQLISAALYALSSSAQTQVDVVSAAPFYSVKSNSMLL